jgi:lysophosphatidate acyltransferase
MTAIAMQEIVYTGFFGISMWLAGLYFIDRKGGCNARQAMNDAITKSKKDNVKLWVFPEGELNNTGAIHQFKKGGFNAAIQAQVPIVPVVFSSYKHFLDIEKHIFDKGEVIITALPEIPTKGLTGKDVDDLIQRTRNAMIDVYNKTSMEVEAMAMKPKKE